MRDGLAERQTTLERARAARAHALAGTRSGRRRAQRELARLVAARERAAAAANAGPGGPWAIPWPIVQCESGGQNLPPNRADASGYYQMLPATWRGLGGSTGHAFQATKAEQDRLAARLWAGGAGARNWVCADLG
jgi:Transglycosylase-like domain